MSSMTNQSAKAAEGLHKNHLREKSVTDTMNQSDSKDSIKSTSNRRSKSLDDLLDDDNLLIIEDERETQSMENILENSDDKTASIESINGSVSPDSEKMCENEVILVDSSMPAVESEAENDDSGIHSMDAHKLGASSFDDDTISNSISITSSNASEKKSGKTFLNKYMKKVKSMIKKWMFIVSHTDVLVALPL